jgi:uncharacterized protein (DUF1501 family)
MTMPLDTRRRQFLTRSAALGTFGLASLLPGIGVSAAHAQAAPAGYKALVCVFLFGGNDGNNLVIPYDPAEYAAGYEAIRPAASGINIPRDTLLPISPAGMSSPYGLHPSLAELQPLFAQGRLAVLANAGPLVEPIDRARYIARSAVLPENLFSHSDQQQQWMAGVSVGDIRSGWGGRIADRLSSANGASGVPMAMSFTGSQTFGNGVTTVPLALPQSGSFGLSGTGSSAAALARRAALDSLLKVDRDGALVGIAADGFERALTASATLNPILSNSASAAAPAFASLNTSLASQLLQVARVIEARASLGHSRDIFVVSQGGYDTHNNQLTTQGQLLADLSQALGAFYQATVALGVAADVTTFTLSDFGRTLKPAAGSPPGSDHAWGNHHLVLGGSVNGGRIHGSFPTLATAGPDDSGSEGRWIPTTAIEQYGTALATWFGASGADLDHVFPNRGRFGPPPALMS